MNHLPNRPHLDHLRKQAKNLLLQLKAGDPDASKLFRQHLPAAKSQSDSEIQSAGYRLADAQSVVARATGFSSWPSLSRHVEQLRQLEGVWSFASLEVDGQTYPPGAFGNSRILIDGDRFLTELPEANYEGVFDIDVDTTPNQIDIEFVEGPEAGNWSYGIFEQDGDSLRICLGLTGAPRPAEFRTSADSGHALEVLHRSKTQRPEGISGGTRQIPEVPTLSETFPDVLHPLHEQLSGEWRAIETVLDGSALPDHMLRAGKRVARGNHVQVKFGAMIMIDAKTRIDDTQEPVWIDYQLQAGPSAGKIQLGILKWEDVHFCFGAPGTTRPDSFKSLPGSGRTYSRWRR